PRGRGLPDGADARCVGGGIIPAIDGRAGYQDIGAGFSNGSGVVGSDAAIDLEVNIATTDQGPGLSELGERFRDEALAAKAGIDRHDQQQVDVTDDMLDRRNGRRRVESHASLLAFGADRLEG